MISIASSSSQSIKPQIALQVGPQFFAAQHVHDVRIHPPRGQVPQRLVVALLVHADR